MKFAITDRAGYTLAEGRIERDRANAQAIVAAIERRIALEKLVRDSARRKPTPVQDVLPRPARAAAPMATRRAGWLQAVRAWAGRLRA